MSAVREQPPEGRYGRSADERADRRLKAVGSVLGVLFLGLLGWFGWYYVVDSEISAEMIKFDVVSASEVQVHLEVRKDEGAEGVCTLRSRSEDGTEVARKDVRIDDPAARVDQVFSLRTTARATSAELLGCTTR
ncbi:MULTISPECIES: DUF4307 domain-containing protein [unclassified Streptomyces]|uniref:DUF4307 domain-containing protein n=1 Tax=unclassified Streptomyces TaxID=2593676 RepID=UPI0006AEFB01|nr:MULTISPECIES: DUF4307 domain-containing protein [unclassified Streptomyces]KOX23138.1 membrane protein [Streptomyces sp. NRRL F-6491]KOX40196.1 membrane protein [Streptomyces sp. NRRL F-6492]